MSSRLTNAAGDPIGYITFDLVTGQTSAPVRVWADPNGSGSELAAGSSDAFDLRARRHGGADPYVSLADVGIDLSFDTIPAEFDLICVALSVVGLVRSGVFVGVRSSGAAGWAA